MSGQGPKGEAPGLLEGAVDLAFTPPTPPPPPPQAGSPEPHTRGVKHGPGPRPPGRPNGCISGESAGCLAVDQ